MLTAEVVWRFFSESFRATFVLFSSTTEQPSTFRKYSRKFGAWITSFRMASDRKRHVGCGRFFFSSLLYEHEIELYSPQWHWLSNFVKNQPSRWFAMTWMFSWDRVPQGGVYHMRLPCTIRWKSVYWHCLSVSTHEYAIYRQLLIWTPSW